MDNFAQIFINFQKRGKTKNKAGTVEFIRFKFACLTVSLEIAELDEKLAPWTHHDSPGKKRADSDDDSFSVKWDLSWYYLGFHFTESLSRCVGVFDTVGSLGLPEELTLHSQKMTTIFGFPDKKLGEHIQYAFHALALNETRADFVSICRFTRHSCSRVWWHRRIALNSNKPKVEEQRIRFWNNAGSQVCDFFLIRFT